MNATDDSNDQFFSITSTGRSPGLDGGAQRVGTLMRVPWPVGMAAAFGGGMEFSSNAIISGDCGGIHANGTLELNANPTIYGDVSASDSVVISSLPVDSLGNPITPIEGVPNLGRKSAHLGTSACSQE